MLRLSLETVKLSLVAGEVLGLRSPAPFGPLRKKDEVGVFVSS